MEQGFARNRQFSVAIVQLVERRDNICLMDFGLKDHQKLIRDTVRQFMDAEVRPFVKEWERDERFPAEAIRKLGEMGCCGMLMPEEWGGPGLDTISYVLMIEE